ncbi:unnamed protein product [Parascedosporium putredinis]|uniref:Beta-xylanase n=1 Tax=Parascedosporium putredinis TaxID=1442378 RepID=A0A9P1GY10_9PEZI|nr:unnamed protein product [Parascedosporium putredinis]CAI7991197.1 unnamed protein product [Parascedosporium putredinis]
MVKSAYIASLLAACATPAVGQLHQLAVNAGLKYFGTCLDNSHTSDAALMAIINNSAEVGQLVPENGQKWAYVQPTQNSFTYTTADVIPNLATSKNLVLRCHTLTWHSQLPNWVANGSWTKAQLQAVIEAHIANVMAHYKGKCYAWDVVNEAADDSGAWRDSVFYRVMGTDFLPISFKAAKAADANTKLYYNDYNLEYNGAKTDRVVEAVNIIKAAGAPIDGVGLQGHLIVGSTPSRANLATVLRRFTALGVEVAYTELDIRHSSVPASSSALTTQANDYANVVGSCLDVTGCVGVTVWGMSDKYSWVPSTFSGAGEALLYDSNMNKKAAWTAVSSVLAAKATGTAKPSSTTTTLVTSTKATSTTAAPATTTTASSSTGQARWGQCGGIGWTGPTTCQSPYTCQKQNDWYSQCL